MAHVIVRDHKGDYGFDGSFRTISVRGQAIGVAAQAAVWSCRTAALPHCREPRPSASPQARPVLIATFSRLREKRNSVA
jgi:hypothetical protein